MARNITDPKSLDADDVKHLLERPWMIEEFERQGFKDEMAAVRDGQPTKDDPTDSTRVTTEALSLGNAAPQIDVPRANGVTDEEGLDDNYEEWTKEELLAEIEARNSETDRTDDQKLAKTGNKDVLAARLHEDDAVEPETAE